MPQLLSRMDDAGWLTPAIAEVLDDLPSLPHDEKFRREQAAILQKRLSDVGAPVRVVRVGVFPSLTLYVLQPGGPRRRAASPATSAEEVARHLPRLREALGAESIGIVPNLRRSTDYIGILVRMAEHASLCLRNLLLMPVFQSAEASTALVMGMDLDQQVVVRDLADLPHLLIVGEIDETRRFLRAMLLNLVLFTTPAESRIALMDLGGSQQDGSFAPFALLPHILGHRLRNTDESLRLLDGLVKECGRRKVFLEQHSAADLKAYNEQVRGQAGKSLPRVVAVMDDLLGTEWLAWREQWLTLLEELLATGPAVGIHLIMTAHIADDTSLPEFLSKQVRSRVVMRTAGNLMRLWQHNVPPPSSFIDGFLIEEHEGVTPLMFGGVSEEETTRVLGYWQHAATQRAAERLTAAEAAGEELEAAAPVPPGPPEAPPSVQTVRPPVPPLPSTAALFRATEALTSEDVKMARARALAAYLGWLAVGPLRDVLRMSEEDAAGVLARLQEEGVLEAGDGPIFRFVRLDEGLDGGDELT